MCGCELAHGVIQRSTSHTYLCANRVGCCHYLHSDGLPHGCHIVNPVAWLVIMIVWAMVAVELSERLSAHWVSKHGLLLVLSVITLVIMFVCIKNIVP